jgi:hypothetical protein
MLRSAHSAMRLPPSLVGQVLRRRYRVPLCRAIAPHLRCLWTTVPRCPCSWYVIQLHDRIVGMLEEFMLKAGAIEGHDLRMEARRIRSVASRDRSEDVVRLDFMAAHRHLIV